MDALSIKVTAKEIAKYRSELSENFNALADIDLIEECDGDLEYTAIRLARRSNIDRVRAEEDSFWLDIIAQARHLLCNNHVKRDLAPNILGGLVGALTTSNNPILVVVATPVAIYIFRETLDIFCS